MVKLIVEPQICLNSIAYVEVLSEEMLVNVSLRDKSAKGIARDIYLQNKTESGANRITERLFLRFF